MCAKNKNQPINFYLTFTGLICKGNSRFLTHTVVSFRDSGVIMVSVLAACSNNFLKTINYIEVQKYLFGINGLTEFFHSEL